LIDTVVSDAFILLGAIVLWIFVRQSYMAFLLLRDEGSVLCEKHATMRTQIRQLSTVSIVAQLAISSVNWVFVAPSRFRKKDYPWWWFKCRNCGGINP
jgi:hypothetical protein